MVKMEERMRAWKLEKISIIIERTKLYGLDSEGTSAIHEGAKTRRTNPA